MVLDKRMHTRMDARTYGLPETNMPVNFFEVGGIIFFCYPMKKYVPLQAILT